MISRKINQIVAAGSVDGVLTTAALLRADEIVMNGHEVDIVFAQAFTVDKVDVSAWKPARNVAFVDLAVNNRDKSMTAAFVARIRSAGHHIVAVCDEHSREDWLEALGTFDGLMIEPQSQSEGKFKSSGAVLIAQLDYNSHMGYGCEEQDGKIRDLCLAADAADRADFTASFAWLVNSAIKSKMHDDSRRVYLARHLAAHDTPDDKIRAWIKEYEAILANHSAIIAAKTDLGDGIIRVNATGKVVDMTTLMMELYAGDARVVVMEAEMFDKFVGGKVRLVAFGTSEKLDLLACIKQAVPTASGFAQKANVAPESEEAALAAVRKLLAK